MKFKILLFFLFVTFQLGYSQTTEILADWDGTDLAMAGAFGNGSFGDSTFAVVANPNASGINTSANVQNWQKANDAATWGGFYYDLSGVVDLTGGTGTLCVDVMSDHDFLLRAKIEKSNDGGADASFNNNYTTAGEWQQICYDLLGPDVNGDSNTAGYTYTRVTFFPEFGTIPASNASYHLDNIKTTTGGPQAPPSQIIANWDGVDLSMAGSFGNGHFGDSLFSIVANPNASGINTSANVQNWQKANDAATWGGFYYDPPEVIDLNGAFGKVCVDIMSDHELVLRAKIEKSNDGGSDASFDNTYNAVGEWQQLCYDLLGPDVNGDSNTAGSTYTRLTFFPDFGTTPDNDVMYHLDNIIKVTGGGGPVGEVISDYETPETTIDMLGSFGNGHFGGDVFNVVTNPNPDAINGSDNVQEWCKANDAATWGGWYMDIDTLDFTGTDATVCFSILGDQSAIIRFKVEGSETGPDVSMDRMYDTPGSWKNICYDFSEPGIDDKLALGHIYNRITFFPDFGNIPASDACYYIDDIYEQTNGIGEVLQTIGDLISTSSDHTTLKSMLDNADMWSAVNAVDVTIFAPTDAAFSAMDPAELDAWNNNTNNKLFDGLLHHVILSEVSMADLAMGNKYLAGNGQDATVTAANSEVDGATISEGDIIASNGLMHITSSVMTLPNNPDAGYLFMDNETDETTLAWTWTPVTIVPNPAPGGINTSATVANFIKTPEGPWWQGSVTESKRVLNFRSGIQEVCVDMLTDHPGAIRFKLERPLTPLPEAGGSPATYITFEDTDAKSVPDEWTQLCADIAVGTYIDGASETHNLEGKTHIFAKPVFFLDYIDAPLPADTVHFYIDNFITKTMTVNTNDLDKLENFTMFPNPTANTLMINTDTPVSRAIIFNAAGIRMMDVTDPLGKQLNVANLPSGLYFIGMQGEDENYIGTAKFVKK